MIIDRQNTFSQAQVVTATAVSTDKMDLGIAGRDIGAGENIFVEVVVDVAMTDSGSDSTVTAELVTDDNESLSSPTVVQTLGTFAALAAAKAKILARVQPSNAYERYIGIRYTVAGGNLTTGSFSAFLVKDPDIQKAYASGYTVAP